MGRTLRIMSVAETVRKAYETKSKICIRLNDGTVYDGVYITDYNPHAILVDGDDSLVVYSRVIEHAKIVDAEIVDAETFYRRRSNSMREVKVSIRLEIDEDSERMVMTKLADIQQKLNDIRSEVAELESALKNMDVTVNV